MAKKTSEIINNLFNYLDYRQFLKDYIEEQKKQTYGFSLLSFSKKIGFNSHTFLKLVIDGKRNLSGSSIYKISSILFNSIEEKEYFTTLVYYNQTDNAEDKQRLLQELSTIKKIKNSASLKGKYSQFYESWYYPVIKELMIHTRWQGDLEKLNSMLNPKISKYEIKKAVDFLLKSGLVIKKDNEYKTPFEHVNSYETPLYIKKNSRREVLELSLEAVDKYSKEQRYTAYSTIMLDKDSYEKILEELEICRKKILKIAANSSPGNIYEIVFNLFPVTNIKKEDLKKGENNE